MMETSAVSKNPPINDGLISRQLEPDDYDRGYTDLLQELTTVGDISKEAFQKRYQELEELDDMYKIAVIVDPAANLVVASATLLIEKKFVHECGSVGHIEDVVVNTNYRGRSLGLRVVDQVKTWAKEAGCYKIILDCASHNTGFYNRLGFVKKEEQMAFYCTS